MTTNTEPQINPQVITFTELEAKARVKFFEWTAECGRLMGLTKAESSALLPNFDPCWFMCYDDKMTPEEAVREYRENTKRERPDIPDMVKAMIERMPSDLKEQLDRELKDSTK